MTITPEQRAEYNRRKRERYANDPEYRQKCRERVRKPKVDNSCRKINGETVPTFTAAEVAKILGAGTPLLCYWIENRHIPSPLFERPRLFTGRQIGLMRELKDAGMKQEPRMRARKKAYKFWNWH